MKVGKKLLSTLLAIMMIVSSVSVCFGVLGAGDPIASLINQINMHHASLIDLIEAAEKDYENEEEAKEAAKKVPSSTGTGEWSVERDTATSSWHWVSYAYSEAAKSVAGTTVNGEYVDTLYDIYVAVKAKINASTDRVMPIDRYDEIIKVFTFGETSNNYVSGATIKVDIKAGFNILQYKDGGYESIPEEAKDLELYKGIFTIEKVSNGENGYKITPDSIKFESVTQDANAIATAIKAIKTLIPEFIGLAGEWFAVDFEALSSDELSAKVFEIAESIQSFETEIITAGISSAEEIWDNFVMPKLQTKKTWAEVQTWYTGEVLGYVAPTYADAYQAKFEELLARSKNEKTGIELLQTYNEITAEVEKLKKVQAYNGKENVDYFDKIVEAFKEYDKKSGLTYYNDVLTRITQLGHTLAETYAQENYVDFVNQFKAILDTANSKHTLRTPEESQALGHVWEKCDGNCGIACNAANASLEQADGSKKYVCTQEGEHCIHYDYVQAADFVLETAETIAIFNTYVFPYITDATGAIVWNYLKNLDDIAYSTGAFEQGEAISLDDAGNWNKYVSQYNVYSLNVGGKEYIDAKVAMDAIINGVNDALLAGATYPIIQNLYNSMLEAGYSNCAAVAKNDISPFLCSLIKSF